MPQEFHRSKSELKRLVRTLNKGWKALRPEDLAPRTPHLDSWTLASYVTGELDAEAQRTINAHIAFCDACFEDYVALAGPEKIAEILSSEERKPKEKVAPPDWVSNDQEKPKEFVIDLAETYGAGSLPGPIRIVAESWAPLPRERNLDNAPPPLEALEASPKLSKVLEVAVGENTYRMALSIELDGSLSYIIAGFHTPLEFPLRIAAKCGNMIFLDHTNDFGYGHFEVPDALGNLLTLAISLHDNEQKLVFRVPKRDALAKQIADLRRRQE